jgi:hypothetical protein
MLKGTTLITTLAAAASLLQGCCCQFPMVNRDDYIVALQLWYLQSSNSVKLITIYFNTLRSGVAAKSVHSVQIDAAKQSVGPHWYLIGIKPTSAAPLLHSPRPPNQPQFWILQCWQVSKFTSNTC